MHYVTADLHGFRDSLLALLQLINLGADDTLYILGDVIDRGPDPIDLLRLVSRERQIRFLLGNHEDMLLKFLQDGSTERWMRNGGAVTLGQWNRLPRSEQLELADFLTQSPLSERVGDYLLVHSGLIVPAGMADAPFERVMARQERNDLLWSREPFYSQPALSGMTVVFGHTSTRRIRESRGLCVPGKMTIWHDELHHDKIGIDCGSYNPDGGQLGCIRLEDLAEYYVPTTSGQCR